MTPRCLISLVVTLVACAALTASAGAATITVKSASDAAVGGDGLCTLREAIETADGNEQLVGAVAGDCAAGQDGPAVRDAIVFEIAGMGVHTLAPATTYGSINDQVEIDGRNGTVNAIRIEIDGAAVPATGGVDSGLRFLANSSDGSHVHHLAIFDFPDDGIELQGSDNEVSRTILGLTQAAVADGNGGSGVAVLGNGNEIADSVISGNVVSGIQIDPLPPRTGAGTTIAGNLIGTDKTGTAAIPNTGDGIRAALDTELSDGDGIVIGGPDDPTPGGACDGDCNLISGNGGDGIEVMTIGTGSLRTEGLTIRGNYAGTDVTGAVAIPNANAIGAGVRIVGATVGAAIAGNLASGNAGGGIALSAGSGIAGPTATTIAGNTVGLAANGSAPLPNGDDGINLDRSVLAGPSLTGTVIGGTADPTPGGTCDGDCNLVSGNGQTGISLFSTGGTGQLTGTAILGNYVGTDRTGTLDRGNAAWGMVLAGARNGVVGAPGAPNVISGNGAAGIELHEAIATGNAIQANLIGVAANGSSPLGNDDEGIETGAGAGAPSANRIGGLTAGQGNTIAHNGEAGVALTGGLTPALDNPVLGNSIYANGGLGIDLRLTLLATGVTENGACPEAEGANRCQEFPLVSAAAGGGAAVAGTLASAPSRRYQVELFSSLAPDPSGNGEGERFLGAVETVTDAAGSASWLFIDPAASLPDGQWVTATATELAGDGTPLSTSELSDALAAPKCHLPGDGGANALAGGAGDELICGFGGPDSLGGGGGRDALLGGDGDDAIDARDGGADGLVDCGSGTDTVSADAEALDPAAIFLGCETVSRPGAVTPPPPVAPIPPVKCAGKAATIVGSDRGETLRGTAKADVIAAGGGADKVKGRAGNDTICGGPGNDKLEGGSGKDALRGEAGKDQLSGGSGKGDLCDGQQGKDTLLGRAPGCEKAKSAG